MIFKNICINLYYKYFISCSIKHAKPLSCSARCVVRLLSMCSLRSRPPLRAEGKEQPAVAPPVTTLWVVIPAG